MLRKAENVTPPAREVVKRKYCAKCQNHQRMEEVKGHKRHCTYQWCRCVKCRTTDEKRKLTARNVQAKREEMLEKEKAASRNLNDDSKTISPPVKKLKMWNEKGVEKPKVEWKSIIALCDDIKGLEIHHLLHLILKEIAPTVEEARYRIIQGIC